MFVTAQNVVHYLVTRGSVNPTSVVHDRCRVDDVSSRNRCFKISFSSLPGIFVKQARQNDSTMRSCIEIEAECLKLFNGPGLQPTLGVASPSFVAFDKDRSILCSSLIPDAKSLRVIQLARPEFRGGLATELGRVLARFHTAPSTETIDKLPAAAHHRVPTLLHRRSLDLNSENDPAGVYARIREYPDYVKLVSATSQYWLADGLMHGDIRWDNILISNTGSSFRLSIIDWELAGLGDTAWDVAGVIQSYLIDWSADLLTAEELHGCTEKFLSGYLSVRDFSGNDRRAFLRKSVIYAGCRLIQSTFEQHQFGTPLDTPSLRLLQLSWNILRDPAAAEGDLLQIDGLL